MTRFDMVADDLSALTADLHRSFNESVLRVPSEDTELPMGVVKSRSVRLPCDRRPSLEMTKRVETAIGDDNIEHVHQYF